MPKKMTQGGPPEPSLDLRDAVELTSLPQMWEKGLKATIYAVDSLAGETPGYKAQRVRIFRLGVVQNWGGSEGVVIGMWVKGYHKHNWKPLWFGKGDGLVVFRGWNCAKQSRFPDFQEMLNVDQDALQMFNQSPDAARNAFISILKNKCSCPLIDCRDLALGQRSSVAPWLRVARRNVAAARASFREGKPIILEVTVHERRPAARRACIEHFGPTCQICGFDFSKVYPGLGDGFIEVHHLDPLGDEKGSAK